ncbi:MAG: acyltransferase family protein [Bacteroidia bacterium]
MEKKYFKDLDGLRFFAFFGVFVYHCGYLFHSTFSPDNKYIKFLLTAFFEQGKNGVSFFFVLSGFLISYLLLQEKRTGKISIPDFYKRRALRIFPLYFLLIVIGFVVIPYVVLAWTGVRAVVCENALSFFFFVPNFNEIELHRQNLRSSSVLSILWSIGVEEQFYLVWPFLIRFIRTALLPYLLLVLFIGSFAFKCFYLDDKYMLFYHTLSVISDLAIGSFLAWLLLYHARVLTFIKNMPSYLIAFIYLGGAMILVLHEVNYKIEGLRIIFPLFAGFVILEQVMAENSLVKMSRFKIISHLGKISYGMYMYHTLVIFGINMLMYRSPYLKVFSLNHSLFLFTSSLLVTVGISFLSYHYFEKLFLRLKYKLQRA